MRSTRLCESGCGGVALGHSEMQEKVREEEATWGTSK